MCLERGFDTIEGIEETNYNNMRIFEACVDSVCYKEGIYGIGDNQRDFKNAMKIIAKAYCSVHIAEMRVKHIEGRKLKLLSEVSSE